MSYSIIAVPSFRKELKRLVKKYPSIKHELAILFETLELNPIQGIPLGITVTKSGYQFLQKAKENQEVLV